MALIMPGFSVQARAGPPILRCTPHRDAAQKAEVCDAPCDAPCDARVPIVRPFLPDWLIKDELDSRDLVQVLPKWKAKDLPIHVVLAGQRVLPTREIGRASCRERV